MWCGDHTDMGVCTFPAQDMHTRNVSTVLTHHRCADVKAVSLSILDPHELHAKSLWRQKLMCVCCQSHCTTVSGTKHY